MDAYNIYMSAKEIQKHVKDEFDKQDQHQLTLLEKERLKVKFLDFAEKNPKIFKKILDRTLNWEQFKTMAEMAHSLHLQMNTDTDIEVAKNVKFNS